MIGSVSINRIAHDSLFSKAESFIYVESPVVVHENVQKKTVRARTDRRVPHIPDFLCSFVGSLNFMRLSLKRAAHAVLSSAAYRKFGVISLVFREMWDTAGLALKPVAGPTDPYGCPTFAPAYVGRKRWATRISYFTAPARTTYAVSLKETA
jgi:hypothetical protein